MGLTGAKLDIAMKRERVAPNFAFSFAKLAIRFTRRSGKREVQKLMDVMFDDSFEAKELLAPHKKSGGL